MRVAELLSAAEAAAAKEDETELAAALVNLCEAPVDELDEHSFEVFDLTARHVEHGSESRSAATQLLMVLSDSLSARELFCMIMDAFGCPRRPEVHIILLGALGRVLPRLLRKRAHFATTCLLSLGTRYLDKWPGDEWDDLEVECDEAEGRGAGMDEMPLSQQLMASVLDCIEPFALDAAAAIEAPVSSPEEGEARRQFRHLTLSFFWRMLEIASSQGADGREHAAEIVRTSSKHAPEFVPGGSNI